MSRLIRFRCECGKKLKAPADIIGRKVRCTRCPKIHAVPPQDSLDADRPKPNGPQAKGETPKVSTQEVQPTKNDLAPSDRPAGDAISLAAAGNQDSKKQDANSNHTHKPFEFLIEDNSPTDQASMLPNDNDGSDDRFQLDPVLDPEPVDEIVGPDTSNSDFDFQIDIDLKALNIEKIAPSKQRLTIKKTAKPPIQKNSAFPLGILSIAAAGLSVVLLIGTVGYWLFVGGIGFPVAFKARPEVKNYIATADQFRKSELALLLASETYIESKAPAAEEVAQIQQFNQSVAPLSNKEATLNEALELFTSFQPEKARTTLVTATQEMSSKIPEMEAKAKNYSQKLR